MKAIFLSFAFRPENRDLVTDIEQLLASHDLLARTGRTLGGGALTPEIRSRIDDCDGLVAVMTRRDSLAGGGWTTHQWVRDEFNHAQSTGKRTIAIVEDGVEIGGALAANERIALDRAAPLPAFLKLSDTLGEWKRRAGRVVKLQILPTTLARELSRGDKATCRYRLIHSGAAGPWNDAHPLPEIGGTYVYLRGVHDDHLIQVMIELKRTRWESRASSQWMPISLARVTP